MGASSSHFIIRLAISPRSGKDDQIGDAACAAIFLLALFRLRRKSWDMIIEVGKGSATKLKMAVRGFTPHVKTILTAALGQLAGGHGERVLFPISLIRLADLPRSGKMIRSKMLAEGMHCPWAMCLSSLAEPKTDFWSRKAAKKIGTLGLGLPRSSSAFHAFCLSDNTDDGRTAKPANWKFPRSRALPLSQI